MATRVREGQTLFSEEARGPPGRAGCSSRPVLHYVASSSFEMGGMSPHYGIRVNPKDIVLVKEACRKWPGLTLNQIIFKHAPPSSIKSEVLLVYSVEGGGTHAFFRPAAVKESAVSTTIKRERESTLQADSSPD